MTLSLLVIIVSSTLVYFSAQMIYEDKRAYLYEDSFQSIQSSLKRLESLLTGKLKIVEASLPRDDKRIKLDLKFWSQDEDLFQIRSFEYGETGISSRKTLYTRSPNKEKTSKRLEPRELSDLALAQLFRQANEKGISSSIIHEKKAPPRFVVATHLPSLKSYVVYDFLVEGILQELFANLPYDITIMNRKGETYFNSHPYNVTGEQEFFYKDFIRELPQATGEGGVKEVIISKTPFILAYSRSSLFKDYYGLGVIKTSEAYAVTSIFILNTALYALALVGFFNIVALFLARSITGPLDAMNKTISSIGQGDYKARVKPQKIMELEIVGRSFNAMVDKIQEYNEQLKEYNRLLEQKVEERTKELREANNFIHATVDSLSQGLVVFNKDGLCHSTYTKACLGLFGRSPNNAKVINLIRPEDKESFGTWVSALFEEPMPFEELVAFGPQSIPVTTHWNDENFKYVGLEFFPMRNDDKVENIVMVATDKTKEFQAAKENEIHQNYINMLSKVLKDKSTFTRFEQQFRDTMREAGEKSNFDRMNFLRQVHSYKGMAGFFSLSKLIDNLHQLESDLSLDSFEVKTLDQRIDQAMALMDEAVRQIAEFSPELMNPIQKIEVEESRLLEFYAMLKPMDQDYALHFKYHFIDWPVENYIDQYKSLIQDLAVKLGKKVNPLIVNNGSLKVDRSAFRPFFDSCIHLFRNGLDHGIETPDKRVALNKDEAGTIALSFDLKDVSGKKYLYFEMKDDGAGISIEAIRNKMSKLGYPPQEVAEEDEGQLLLRIFDAEFSTAETTTDISGRGIGLYDIKMLVEKYHGDINVVTRPNEGTTFAFYLLYEMLS